MVSNEPHNTAKGKEAKKAMQKTKTDKNSLNENEQKVVSSGQAESLTYPRMENSGNGVPLQIEVGLGKIVKNIGPLIHSEQNQVSEPK